MGFGSGIRDPRSEIRNPRSGKNLFRIPDPGVIEAPKPGSATLFVRVDYTTPWETNWYPYFTSSKPYNNYIGLEHKFVPTWTSFVQPCYDGFCLPNSAMNRNLLVTADPERPEDAINQLASFRELENKQTATFSLLALHIFQKNYCFLPFTLPATISKGKKFDLKKIFDHLT
jgi:hypothetical protein